MELSIKKNEMKKYENYLASSQKDYLPKFLFLLIAITILAISYNPAEIYRWTYLFTDATNMAEYLSGFLKPDFSEMKMYIIKMFETIYIAIWGTFLSLLAGIPLSLMASKNISKPWIVLPVRRLMDAARAINEIVFAILFVAAVGLGPFAGVMAIFVHNTGIISKLFSEAVESIDMRPIEGIKASGGNFIHQILYGVIPQVMPLWTSFYLYRFETSVRSATVLGIIGAGGIGLVFYESFRGFQYSNASAIIILIVITVSIIDHGSAKIRQKLL